MNPTIAAMLWFQGSADANASRAVLSAVLKPSMSAISLSDSPMLSASAPSSRATFFCRKT